MLRDLSRCMCGHFPKNWSVWILVAKWWYNSNYHTAIKRFLFEALYGFSPPQLGYGPHLITKTAGVEVWVKEHQNVTRQLKKLLGEAQRRMRDKMIREEVRGNSMWKIKSISSSSLTDNSA